jgi:aspartate aminotransferase-like enzyme
MIPPGLAFISISEKAWALAEQSRLPKFYFDVKKSRKSFAKHDTPFTPAHTLMEALSVSLEMIAEEGIDAVVARHARLAAAVRAGVQALDLPLYSTRPANALTAVLTEGIDAEDLRAKMQADGVFVAGGQEDAKGKIIRIAMMGYATESDVVNALQALERALKAVGYTFEPGTGVLAGQQELLK